MMANDILKFGRAIDCDSGTDTDIWDRADGSGDSQAIWVAPTQARVHNIASTSANDTAGGTGARSLELYGLSSWIGQEISETIALNGTSNVATVNSYVIVHRMKCTDWGASGPNVGEIKATAVTDGSVTAQINVGEGQTQMAIYGIGAGTYLDLDLYYASAIKASSSLAVAVSLLVNPIPDSQLAGFLVKHTNGATTEGTNYIRHEWSSPFRIHGPAIIKLQANSSANNTDVSGGFDGTTNEPLA